MTMLRCISPADGSLVAERPVATEGEIAAVLAAARRAQPACRPGTLADRARICTVAVDAMLAQCDEIVPELAWQMGRPVDAAVASCAASTSGRAP
jgi:acyl-CoA reductase-like NAD-dependent aldehyde dehydrogenase